jgi:UDP-2,4-diacetamido-2,4,6-trideoxy-beta-L-altropyranose hydrolase
VVDHYGIDHRWETELRESVGRIMVIDDLADRPHDCDLLLDQNLVADSLARYADKVPEGCALLLGPQYALLESVYMQMHDRVSPRAGPIRRILIAFGGADSGGFASRTVSAILTMDRADIDVDVAISAKSRQDPLIQTVSMDHPNIHVHVGLPSLAPLLANADLAIGAGGTTTWERLCLGVPSVVMTVAPNQYPAALELNRRGLICWLGGIDQVSSSTLVAALENLIEKGLDGSWSRRCLELVDGRGANRVSAALMVSGGAALRPRRATADDEDLLLAWANDPETRRNGFSSEAIPARTHHAWFRERLLDADACRLYIIETVDRLPVGMVRFERQARAWEVHYSISRIFRRQGLGRKVLETALADLVANMPDASVFGQVKNTNRASRKIFESLGFNVVSSEGEGVVVYERRLSVLTSSEREGKQ